MSKGISFAELHEQGIDCVVSGIEMRYKLPLRSRDEYAVRINVKKEGLRFIFLQDIYRLPDNKLCLKAKVEAVCVVNGKLGDCDILEKSLCNN